MTAARYVALVHDTAMAQRADGVPGMSVNYRHAFHAGNFADVMKHALLARILVHLGSKPAPFRFVDTHAGIGLYDLAGPEAVRSPEWRDGVGRLDAPLPPSAEAVLAPYRDVLARVRARHGPLAYPGSPAIARELLRPGDRAVLVEAHPDDAAALSDRYNAVSALKVLRLDGWTALGSLLPPPERRGLVLIDPPYEEPGELGRVGGLLAKALRRWPTGCLALWYPIKAGDPPMRPDLPREALRLELHVVRPALRGPLTGSGLLVANPPWTLAADAEALLPALAERLGRGPGAAARIDALPPSA